MDRIDKNIIVKDYLYKGNYIFGSFYEVKQGPVGDTVKFILDDGDIYSEKDLIEDGYEYIFISSADIIDAFKKRFSVRERNTTTDSKGKEICTACGFPQSRPEPHEHCRPDKVKKK